MQCTRCGEELPGDTPICRKCGPSSFGSSPWASSAAAVTPVVAAPMSFPALTTPALPEPTPFAAPPTPESTEPRPAAVPPPIPSGPPRLTKREKKERARQRLAERGLLTPEPTFAERAGSSADGAPPLPTLEGRPAIGENVRTEILERLKGKGIVVPDNGPYPVQFPVPPAIRLMAQVDFVMGLAALGVALAMARGVPAAHATTVGGGFGVPMLCLFGLACLVAAAGLITLQPFGRKAQLGLCVAALPLGGFNLPAAALIAIHLMRPGVALQLSGLKPGELTPEQRGRIRDDAAGQRGLRLIRIAAAIQMVILVYHLWPLLRSL